MRFAFVLSSDRKPLDPVHPGVARRLLSAGKAAVFRSFPFTIILKDGERERTDVHKYRVKVDPGSKKTGVVVERDGRKTVWASEIEHRGDRIRAALLRRRLLRRNRRIRNLRYRKRRNDNRRRGGGRLTPSVQSRVENILTWVSRLSKVCPISGLALEMPRFDPQKIDKPWIKGWQYNTGPLKGSRSEREHLLLDGHRACAYCGRHMRGLHTEHVIPKIRGGTESVRNKVLACPSCNKKKGARTATEFGRADVGRGTSVWFRHAGIVNSMGPVLLRRLGEFGLPVEVGTGRQTHANRRYRGLPEAHWVDAACVGSSGRIADINGITALRIRAEGHGKRQRCRTNKYGFPIAHAPRKKRFMGWRTGDIAVAVVPKGTFRGVHVGRVAIRFTPKFRVGNWAEVHPRHLTRIHKADGYGYAEAVA